MGQYRYDILGNRTRLTDASGAYLSYQYNGMNQLTRGDVYDVAGVPFGTQLTQTFDNAGNLATKTAAGFAQSFTWNANNELAAVLTQTTTGGVTTSSTEQYWYDHLRRRVVRMVNGGQVLSQYLYNGADIHEEYGSSFVSPVSRFTHGPATDDPLLAEKANGRYYYHADARGSVSLMTEEAGTSGAWRRYDPWGRVLGGAGTPLQYGYTGREPDRTTGLVSYRARHYDPEVGRFTGTDQIDVDPAAFGKDGKIAPAKPVPELP